MATYRLDLSEPIADSVRRTVLEQLTKAEDQLTDSEIDRDEGVHEARKCLKKLRGLVRLVRPALGSSYKLENAILRDAGRDLASARDADAMIACFGQLTERYGSEMENSAKSIRTAIDCWRTEIMPDDEALESKAAAIVSTLHQADERSKFWPLPEDNEQLLMAGLRKSYKRGRNAYRKAYMERTGERFHDWRKRVKYHWYHLRLLRDIWPKLLKAWAKEAKQLSDLLGDDHDLTVLQSLVERDAIVIDEDAAKALLLGLIERRQRELRADAHALGGRLFAEKPKRLTARLATYWAMTGPSH